MAPSTQRSKPKRRRTKKQDPDFHYYLVDSPPSDNTSSRRQNSSLFSSPSLVASPVDTDRAMNDQNNGEPTHEMMSNNTIPESAMDCETSLNSSLLINPSADLFSDCNTQDSATPKPGQMAAEDSPIDSIPTADSQTQDTQDLSITISEDDIQSGTIQELPDHAMSMDVNTDTRINSLQLSDSPDHLLLFSTGTQKMPDDSQKILQELQELQAQSAQKDKTIQQVIMDNHSLKAVVQKQKRELTHKIQELDNLTTKTDTLDDKNSEQRKRISQLEKKLESETDTLDAKNSEQRKRISQLEKQLESLKQSSCIPQNELNEENQVRELTNELTSIIPPESKDNLNNILIIGTSQVKFVRPKSLLNTTVRTLSGAQILAVHNKLLMMDITSYTHIILQVGTNDIHKRSGLIRLEYELLIKAINLMASPDIQIIVSGLPLRCNDKDTNERIS